jgi:HEPN domain-containing protein
MPKRLPAEDPWDWLSRARFNLVIAREPHLLGGPIAELVFNAHQAAEKAIKAVILHKGKAFPYTHDIRALLATAKEAGIEVPTDILDAERLSAYAVAGRYPGGGPPVTKREYEDALMLADKVVRWAENRMEKPKR